jgi:hypothetical protein
MWSLKSTVVIGIASITIAALSAWKIYGLGKSHGEAKIQALWNEERAILEREQGKQLIEAKIKQETLQAKIDQQRRSHKHEIERIVREHADIVDGLRERPERPTEGSSGLPESADAGVGLAPRCTGAELYRQDSEFLAREAARADQLRIALKACLSHANAVESELNASHPASTRP